MTSLSYRGYRFPAAVIQHAIWLYLRFTLSYRDVEEWPQYESEFMAGA
jgi:putative transposase